MKDLIFALLTITFIMVFLWPDQVKAQTDKELLIELVAEEQEAVNALVLYPEETRKAILEATQYPEILIKVESIQSQTAAAFKALLENYPKPTQEMLWDLTRYPGLVEQLTMVDNLYQGRLKEMLEPYPEEIHQRARNALDEHFHKLTEIRDLNNAAESTFMAILNKYPHMVGETFEHLLMLPEVLTILTENIRLTILVGDLYQKEPEWIIQKADSLNLEVARQNAQELDNWKQSLEDNPQVRDELQASAEEYADEYGYNDEYYEYDDLYYDYEEPFAEDVVVHHYYHHYPFWFGYPHWYVYPRWRPYPLWYDWGFYFGPQRQIVVLSLPSYHFTHWYFYHPQHHIYWSNLSTHFVRHYDHHRYYSSSISRSVINWNRRNGTIITNRWMKDDGRLSQRFVEYGKYEVSRSKYNQINPKRMLSQREYVERHSNRYPELSKSARTIEAKKETIFDSKIRESAPQQGNFRNRKPNEIKIERKESEARKRQIEPGKIEPNKKTTDRTIKRRVTPPKEVPNVNKGKEHHRNTWEKSKAPTRTTDTRKLKRSSPKKSPTKNTTTRTRTKSEKKVPIKRKKNN